MERSEIFETGRKTRVKGPEELITLGGANGTRSPKRILDDIITQRADGIGNDAPLPSVIFNDLSPRAIYWAQKVLKPYEDMGVQIEYLLGPMKDACRKINRQPRRFLLGVYNCRSFFEAMPWEGYPHCGYDSYLDNYEIPCTQFLFEWVKFSPQYELVSCGLRTAIGDRTDTQRREFVKRALAATYRDVVNDSTVDFAALQVIGTTPGQKGFYNSQWYTEKGILQLVRSVFSPEAFSIEISHFAKGMLFTIDPIVAEVSSIVLLLDNTLGNVLPHSQYETLSAIRDIMS